MESNSLKTGQTCLLLVCDHKIQNIRAHIKTGHLYVKDVSRVAFTMHYV